jgi:hypothetical protein
VRGSPPHIDEHDHVREPGQEHATRDRVVRRAGEATTEARCMNELLEPSVKRDEKFGAEAFALAVVPARGAAYLLECLAADRSARLIRRVAVAR